MADSVSRTAGSSSTTKISLLGELSLDILQSHILPEAELSPLATILPSRRHNGAERKPSADMAHHRKVTASGMPCAIIVLRRLYPHPIAETRKIPSGPEVLLRPRTASRSQRH